MVEYDLKYKLFPKNHAHYPSMPVARTLRSDYFDYSAKMHGFKTYDEFVKWKYRSTEVGGMKTKEEILEQSFIGRHPTQFHDLNETQKRRIYAAMEEYAQQFQQPLLSVDEFNIKLDEAIDEARSSGTPENLEDWLKSERKETL